MDESSRISSDAVKQYIVKKGGKVSKERLLGHFVNGDGRANERPYTAKLEEIIRELCIECKEKETEYWKLKECQDGIAVNAHASATKATTLDSTDQCSQPAKIVTVCVVEIVDFDNIKKKCNQDQENKVHEEFNALNIQDDESCVKENETEGEKQQPKEIDKSSKHKHYSNDGVTQNIRGPNYKGDLQCDQLVAEDDEELKNELKKYKLGRLYPKFNAAGVDVMILWNLDEEMIKLCSLNVIEKMKYTTAKETRLGGERRKIFVTEPGSKENEVLDVSDNHYDETSESANKADEEKLDETKPDALTDTEKNSNDESGPNTEEQNYKGTSQQETRFKINLKKELDSKESNPKSCRIKMDVTKVGKFNNLKTAAIDKLQGFGLTKNNFVLFWQDDAKSYNIVKDDEDLDLALEELKTPLVELIASPKETEPKEISVDPSDEARGHGLDNSGMPSTNDSNLQLDQETPDAIGLDIPEQMDNGHRLLDEFEAMEGFRKCLVDGCGAGQIHEAATDATGLARQPIVTCHKCGAKSCYSCKKPWHEGRTCQQSEFELMDDFRPCLAEGCNFGQIHEGRDSMPIVTCQQCGAKSCYSCKVPWLKGSDCTTFHRNAEQGPGNGNEINVPEDILQQPDIRREHFETTETYDDVDRLRAATNEPKTIDSNEVTDLPQFDAVENFRNCLAEGCGYGQIHEDLGNQPIVTCNKCKSKSCYSCRVPWHEGRTCEEFNLRSEQTVDGDSALELPAPIVNGATNFAHLEAIPNFRKCLADGCGFGQIHEQGEIRPIVTCIKCKAQSCFSCKIPWHAGRTCKELAVVDPLRGSRENIAQDIERDPEGPMYECAICFQEENPAHFFWGKNCSHDNHVCLKCFDSHISARISDGIIGNINCPIEDCNISFSGYEIFEFATRTNADKYAHLNVIKALGNMNDFRWCKAEGCGSGQICVDGDDNPLVTCYACNARSCYTHDGPWHPDETCAEYDARKGQTDEDAFNEYINAEENNVKQCPRCKQNIQKNEGCEHMTCRQEVGGCGYEFCWTCLADYDPIRKNDNSFHNPTCRWHSDNL